MSGALKRDEWETVWLGDVATYVSDRIDASLLDTHNYVSVENLLADRRGIKDSENVPQTGRFIQYVSGDVLIGNIRPYLKKIWLAIHEGGTNGDVLVIRPNNSKNLSSEYLYHSLASDVFFNYAMQNAKGAKMPRGDKKLIMKYSFPLPPIDIQHRIADTLDKVTELIDLRKTQLEKLDELVKARFVELFSDCKNIVAMNDLCSIITDGTHQPPKFQSDGIPFIFVSNLANNTVTYNAEKFISEETYNDLIKRTPIEIGDILLTTVGSYGHPAVVVEERKFLFQRHIAYLKLKHDLVNSFYLHSALLAPDGQRQIEEKVKGIAQKTLNLSEIRKIMIPIPSIEEQNAFELFIKQTDKSKVIIQQSLDTLETLKKSLMQEYFG